MVAYNFMKQFADDVEAGRKDFTIRADRKRHARPGEDVQLYTGQRTTQCRKLVDPDPICERVVPIVMSQISEHHCMISLDNAVLTSGTTDYLIVTDGFKSHKEFMEFHLGDAKSVKKVFIQWGFWNVN